MTSAASPASPPSDSFVERGVGLLKRRPALAPSALGLLGVAGLAYTTWQDPFADGMFPACGFRDATGWDCPGCGGLRAVHSLTHGRFLDAADLNLLAAVLVPVAIVVWLVWMRAALRGRSSPLQRVPWPTWAALAVGVVMFGILRNIEGVQALAYLGSST